MMATLKVIQKILPTPNCTNVFDHSARAIINGMKLYKGLKQDDFILPDDQLVLPGDILDHSSDDKKFPASGMQCTICRVEFDTNTLQREHYKLDWHRFNAKQKILVKPPVSEEDFNSQISGELSSISGSDSESDDDLEPITKKNNSDNEDAENANRSGSSNLFFEKHHMKCFFVSETGNLVSLYRNVVERSLKANIKEDNPKLSLTTGVWIYLMFSTGHFAGVVYESNKVVAHKTFHRYTVRAKRGKAQSMHDKAGQMAKSAGASIRRYNEAALNQEVQSLLITWSKYFQQADKVFYKCSTYNSHVLFSHKDVIAKDDERCSKISLNTRRPTLNEVKRIHLLFSTIEDYGAVTAVEKALEPYLQKEKDKEDDGKQDRTTSNSHTSNSQNELNKERTTVEGGKDEPKIIKEGNKKKKKTQKPAYVKASKTIEEKEDYIETDENKLLWYQLYDWCLSKELEKLQNFFHQLTDEPNKSNEQEVDEEDKISENENEIQKLTYESSTSSQDAVKNSVNFLQQNYLNFCSKKAGETLLHGAVKSNSREIISLLMYNGCDPCTSDLNGKVPYDIAANKETRNEFRRFMAKHSEKYDYKKANIPSPLTEVQEEEQWKKNAEKKKSQTKARKDRMKTKKSEERQQKLAEKEHKAFDALSDREKRAVMAERRFASQLTNSLRCSNCRNAISEKESFERFEYKYCSTECVQQHKLLIGK